MLVDVPAELHESALASLEAQGFTVIHSTETPTYRSEWGAWEAVRDLVQNALDETEDFQLYRRDSTLYVGDQGAGFGIRAFLLGQPRPKPDWQRGRYGEGMKLAIISFLRAGNPVSFETVGLEGAATFVTRRIAGEEVTTLAFLIRPGGRSSGTLFKVRNYTGDLYELRFTKKLLAPIARVPSAKLVRPIQRYNAIYAGSTKLPWLEGPTPPGWIYIRDIYMGDRATELTYNFWDVELAPDRHGPKDEYELYSALGEVWSGVTELDLIRYFLRQVTQKGGGVFEMRTAFSYKAQNRLQANSSFWREAWRHEFGASVISTSPALGATVIHLGYTPLTISWDLQQALSLVIPTDTAIVKEMGEKLRSDMEMLPDKGVTGAAAANLQAVRELNSIMPTGAAPRPDVRPALYKDSKTEGTYDALPNTIGIRADKLASLADTLDVYIHEYAHYATGAKDGEEAHTRAISLVGAWVAAAIAKGRLSQSFYNATVW